MYTTVQKIRTSMFYCWFFFFFFKTCILLFNKDIKAVYQTLFNCLVTYALLNIFILLKKIRADKSLSSDKLEIRE